MKKISSFLLVALFSMVSLGWGHALPMDDILTSHNGRVAV